MNMLPRQVILLLLLASSQAGAGGYNFSISASSTDPFVNTATPTGGIRNVYLWLTCSEDGISAFEGDVTGTLGVLAFTTMNGVMNAGGASNLLLAVPNCPCNCLASDLLTAALDALYDGRQPLLEV